MLAAVARPQWDPATRTHFDGKISVWSFLEHTLARRMSRNRAAETLVLHKVSVTCDTYRAMVIDKLLPAIVARWPGGVCTVQQDNAPAHIVTDDSMLAAAVHSCNVDVRLSCQPTNSPDLNVLDLGTFNV